MYYYFFSLKKKEIAFTVIELKGENARTNEKNEITFLHWTCRKPLLHNMC